LRNIHFNEIRGVDSTKDKRNKRKYEISKYNEKAIEEYIKNMMARGFDNPTTLESNEINIRKVLSIINKDYDKITESDLDKAFSSIKDTGSRELAKTKVKAFLKFHKLEELAKHIQINSRYFKKVIKTDNDVLTSEEIQKIRSSPLILRDKAIFELMVTTGMRRGELVSLKVQNIEITKDEIIARITDSKTRNRNISIIPYEGNPIAFFPSNFVAYYENHAFKEQGNKPLFYSVSKNTKHEHLNPLSLSLLFDKVQRVSEIAKKITPHILRHTAATYDGYHLTEGELCLKYGWRPGSDMSKRYCHLNEINFNEQLKRKAGLTPERVEVESKCPFCDSINNINAIRCSSCQRIINKDEMAKIIGQRVKSEEAFNDLHHKYEEANRKLEELEQIIKKTIQQQQNVNNVFNDIKQNILNYTSKRNLALEDFSEKNVLKMLTGKNGKELEEELKKVKKYIDMDEQVKKEKRKRNIKQFEKEIQTHKAKVE